MLVVVSPVQSPLGCMYNMMAKDTCVGDHKVRVLFCIVCCRGCCVIANMTAIYTVAILYGFIANTTAVL